MIFGGRRLRPTDAAPPTEFVSARSNFFFCEASPVDRRRKKCRSKVSIQRIVSLSAHGIIHHCSTVVAMASEYRIHKPFVLATLPRPLDHTEGRIVAREVYGLRDGQKKRKRTELVVGVDGETISIYDVCFPTRF